ncbi:SpoIIE family protein phosphatase [Streptomyces sp. NBC_01465]|uniref:SpoIIE family protein phosphatase n=1 Tax=Streptomyces sp. NBC_01465 TaxID=2903878 RepID=UPI002E31B070|nr:SpoIIE family protein phosphatase [Streptomyces sp. NBC_01465]
MTTSAPSVSVQIRIDHYSAVHLAAAAARRTALEHGLPGALPDRAAVVASELAGNLANHAQDGSVYIQPLPLHAGVEILAVDRGPGMADPELCLTDGFTTTGTMGSGLGAVRRIATELSVRTKPGIGTLISARLTAPSAGTGAERRVRSFGALCLPAEGEEECGDAWGLAETDGDRTAAVIDGLGHGPPAAEAAQAALRAFHRDPGKPLANVMAAMNRSLRRTRGAAVGLLRQRDGETEFCSVGNVRAHFVTPDGVRSRFGGQPGVVGLNMPLPRTERLATDRDATLVVHSDGINSRWSHDPSPFLLRLPPPLLAGALAHGHRRVRDDATVLALGPTVTKRDR